MSDARKNTADLRHRFVAPDERFQSRRKFSASEASGAIELGWYRGHQSGIHDAYKTLRKKFPKAAAVILKAFEMNRDGSVGIRGKKKK